MAEIQNLTLSASKSVTKLLLLLGALGVGSDTTQNQQSLPTESGSLIGSLGDSEMVSKISLTLVGTSEGQLGEIEMSLVGDSTYDTTHRRTDAWASHPIYG